jgi:glycosyltransferase involved in cell wall biosynthesis
LNPNRPLRILEVVVRFFPYVGGVENTVLHLSRELVRKGHQVRVVCADEPSGGPAEVDGIGVVRLPYRGKIGNTNLSWGLLDALRREEADVIHAHMPTAWFADGAGIVAEEKKIPLVLSYNNDLVGPGLKGVIGAAYNRWFLPRLLRRSTRIVTSNPGYGEFSPHLRPFSSKIEHIPWGVDAKTFSPAPFPQGPERIVGFLAILDRHHRYKGLDELLHALAILRAGTGPNAPNGHPVRLRVGGSGEELPRYRALAAELGVADQVDFLGFVPHEGLADFFRSCHLFALPSTDGSQEGFGLVLLEAMACGRPVLTTPVVGMARDIETAGAGFLVPPRDAAALSVALSGLIHDEARLHEIGRRGRSLVEERFTWRAIAGRYEALFLER